MGPSKQVYAPSEVAEMKRGDCLFHSGAGDLVFQTVTTVRIGRDTKGNLSRSQETKKYGFLAIERVKEVEQLVKEKLSSRL